MKYPYSSLQQRLTPHDERSIATRTKKRRIRGGAPMRPVACPWSTVQQFQAGVHGRLICPHDEDYDQTRRVWNGRIDRYPAALLCCADVGDVVKAVLFAREHHLLVAVRSGGHSLSGSSVCDKGLVIDLSGMKGIRVA